jgi:oligoribonuclease NrnB/cAMP/cGMP phosphodiesterase (DHH superfamily)
LKKEEIVCLYHANCTDGSASAAVIKHKYPKARCHPVSHGDSLDVDVTGKKVFIVDFSYPAQMLEALKSKAKEVHWYDHHVTSLPIQKQVGWGVINLQESGASLTWKQEYPDRPLPKILSYVRDKDLYEWKLPDSRAISMTLANQPDIHNPGGALWRKLIDRLSDRQWKQMVKTGERALAEQRVRIVKGTQNGFELEFHGHRAFAVNWSLEASDIGEYVYTEMQYPLVILFYYNGESWTFSLRSPSIDVSKLALEHGGGGHPGAAGFRTEDIGWFLKLKK